MPDLRQRAGSPRAQDLSVAARGPGRGPFLALLGALALPGCAAVSDLGGGMKAAAREPMTWVPLAAGAALVVTGTDQQLSDWARRETPLFGSTQGASDASDSLMLACEVGWVVATLTAPSEDEHPMLDRLEHLGVGYLAVVGTGFSTDLLKDASERMRPDGSDDRSFPSGHASRASVTATLGADQAHERFDEGGAATAVDVAFLTAAFGTGWARVEAGKHHPSDVLAGYALGRWIGRSVELAFFDRGDAPLAFAVTPEGIWVSVSW